MLAYFDKIKPMEAVIKKIQRFLKTDTSYLIKGGAWLSVIRASSLVVAFFLSILYARYLSKETYGNYRYILNALGIFSFLSLPGLGTSMVYAVARGFEGSFRKTTILQFLSGLFFIAVGVGGFFWFLSQGKAELAFVFLIGSLFMILVEPSTNYQGYYNAKKDFKARAFSAIGSKIFYGLIMLAAILSIRFLGPTPFYSLLILVCGYLAASTLPHLFFLYSALKSVPKNAPSEKNLLSDGIKFTIIDIPTHVTTYLDSIIIFHLLGPVELAIYSFAEAIPDQIRGTLKSIGTSLASPKLATKDIREIEESGLFGKIARFSILLIPAVIAYILLAPYIYQYLYPKYIDSIFISQLLAISLLAIPGQFLAEGLRATRQIKYASINSFIGSISQIILFIIFIPIFGLLGAAIARIAGRFFSFFLSGFLILLAGRKNRQL
ncbi:hypothetical protein A2Z53_03330 [Candidatus Giovannonibacteria bacterium RIFCSPHIGHO2_02_42_15]|uniref:Uncharacterized protein n=2 Tax=Candidatus Giovannoniibacteriota TaxID=1752738 RepID=A0A1F5VMM2_9BACT|nr:MAG: Polysaccharide biosynthesis protein [Candidatus Giovannonibacteria bacterium GW2011_GWF2_42_19]OGF64508.1 MAG: hypothetical protein A2Z53_03330 [Candidatus Giovannonibacteria bacterium RIFCSPHIGHO2_02_42_15]